MAQSQELRLASFYLAAKAFVLESGYHAELDWQENVSFSQIQESDFLRESAWVILSAGFRERVVRRKFPAVSEAFLHWQSANGICDHASQCRRMALLAFSNRRKIFI